MEKSIAKISKYFPHKILTGINSCLRVRDSISATILICCAIDLLSKYFSGDISKNLNKRKYIQFLKRYFPQYASPEDFYEFIRCGLVHSYNMEGKFILVNSNANWAQKLHMIYSSKHKATLVNPFSLKKDLQKALKIFISDLKQDKKLREKVRIVYKKYPLVGQSMKISKFTHLAKMKGFS